MASNGYQGGYTPKCYESHPALKIGEFVIYGGSCARPIVSDADIYVGFDLSIKDSPKAYPWEPGESFLYYIQDMHAPADATSFKKFIGWLAEQLTAQKKIHLGCIGGHGRTGLVLAALVTYMTGELDSISYVRKHYCERAVESGTQVEFLNKHFGITKVMGFKESHRPAYQPPTGGKGWPFDPKKEQLDGPKGKAVVAPKAAKNVKPLASQMSIWGPAVTLDKLPNSGNMKV